MTETTMLTSGIIYTFLKIYVNIIDKTIIESGKIPKAISSSSIIILLCEFNFPLSILTQLSSHLYLITPYFFVFLNHKKVIFRNMGIVNNFFKSSDRSRF